MACSNTATRFLSTLSLRRATREICFTKPCKNFYPRSPCGERPTLPEVEKIMVPFLSTLSLRRATGAPVDRMPSSSISIHALLAESDGNVHYMGVYEQISIHALLAESDYHGPHPWFFEPISIHALLAESDALEGVVTLQQYDFYPRSPCGERRRWKRARAWTCTFLSTLSLRRATRPDRQGAGPCSDFYPRSPCGERP